MGVRYRKSINIGGVRFNLNKRGVSASVGTKGARYTVNSAGRRTTSVGLPGTGLRYQTQSGGHHQATQASPRTRTTRLTQPVQQPAAPRPGLFASKGQKRLWAALQQAVSSAPAETWLRAAVQAGRDDASLHLAADTLAGVLGNAVGAPQTPALLSSVWSSSLEPAADPFIRRYAARLFMTLTFSGVATTLPVGRELVGLMLCSQLQRDGHLEQALGVATVLPDNPLSRLIRSQLLVDTGRPAEALPLSEGLMNTDDIAVLLLTSRATALRATGHAQAAVEVCREALRYPSRGADPRQQALLERARAYLDLGQKLNAWADVEKVLAQDSSADGLHDLLTQVNSAPD